VTQHDLEEQAARKALEAAEIAFRSARYSRAPYTTGMIALRKIDPSQFRTDRSES